jgi:hypothetical protein
MITSNLIRMKTFICVSLQYEGGKIENKIESSRNGNM